MKAILLAAGFGTRLRPLTDTVPKCLVPVQGRPLLDYWLDLLLGTGAVSDIILNTHWLASTVTWHLSNSRWREHVDIVHEDTLLGTGGTILENYLKLNGAPFLVAHADNLTQFDPLAFCERHRRRPPGVEITMMTFRTDAPSSCGIVETNSEGVVTAFHEKVANPPGNIANAAVYIFEPGVVDFLISLNRPVIDLSLDVLPAYVGKMVTYLNNDYHRDIGTLDSLQKAEKEWEGAKRIGMRAKSNAS